MNFERKLCKGTFADERTTSGIDSTKDSRDSENSLYFQSYFFNVCYKSQIHIKNTKTTTQSD